ncbi:MAG: hypothetical protein FWG21_00130 [Oscillospiraceae bacterium]|nr:hypothetical protein [Oscillospiraceae bacterium]
MAYQIDHDDNAKNRMDFKEYKLRKPLFNPVPVNTYIYGLIGALVFVSVFGFLPLNPMRDAWIMNGYVEGDIIGHYAG